MHFFPSNIALSLKTARLLLILADVSFVTPKKLVPIIYSLFLAIFSYSTEHITCYTIGVICSKELSCMSSFPLTSTFRLTSLMTWMQWRSLKWSTM